MYDFCTYFDHRYLSRGLALYRSLENHCHSFRLFVLCMDRKCYQILADYNLANIELISLDRFEQGDVKLQQAKQNRSLIEYYFTCTPSLPLYIFKHHPKVNFITYLDADLYFFADPSEIFEEIGDNSVAIIAHRFPPHQQYREMHGKYNVGCLFFRRDKNGMSCLRWYREKCNEWCYDKVENDRYADQKYLDYFPSKFEGVVELRHKGANLAPWNIDNYKLTIKKGKIYVDEKPLVFFHFHDLKKLFGFVYDSAFFVYKAEFTEFIRQNIYLPYLKELTQMDRDVQQRIVTLTKDVDGEMTRIRSAETERPTAIHPIFAKALRIFRSLSRKTFILWHGN